MLLAAILMAVGTVVVANAVIRGYQGDMMNDAVNTLAGHVKVLAPGYRADPSIDKSFTIAPDWRPALDPALLVADTIALAVQVNGKRRDEIQVAQDADEAQIRAAALVSPKGQKHLDGREPRRVIVVPGRLVNVVA